MRKLICAALLLAVFVAAIQACNNRKGKNYNNKTLVDDQGLAFLKAASESGLTEVEASTMAQSRSKNPRVVKFAGMLAEDHTKINEELKKIETDSKVTPVDTIGLDKQELIANLSNKTGDTLDKAYISMMISDHEKAIDLFKSAAQSKISSVKKFANAHLPALVAHLDSAKVINASLK